jgi:16S rRNA (uracil1498-N3)-methyltransferase
MECLYAPHLSLDTTSLALTDDECIHARALRLREGDLVLLSNGVGLCAEAVVSTLGKVMLECAITTILTNHNEPHIRLHLALGILDNRERMEMAVEKGTELGMIAFTPLLTDHSQRDRVNSDRLHAKALAALKQSQRSRLPRIMSAVTVEDFLRANAEAFVILADAQEGQVPLGLREQLSAKEQDIWLVIGPEGGFSERELHLLKPRANALWQLGGTRLRAETAAIIGLGVAGVMFDTQ